MQDNALPNFGAVSVNQPGLHRAVEVVISIAALIVFFPVLVPAAAAVLVNSPGRIIFRQERIGIGGRRFVIYKLRTMHQSDEPAAIATKHATRTFAVGRFLRRTKIDELPGFWNVLRGDMALVGPRPELPRYVDREDPLWRRVLLERPGLTHPVTLHLTTEEKILSLATGDPEAVYKQTLLPQKLRAYIEYANRRTWKTDFSTIADTAITMFRSIVIPHRDEPFSLPQQ